MRGKKIGERISKRKTELDQEPIIKRAELVRGKKQQEGERKIFYVN